MSSGTAPAAGQGSLFTPRTVLWMVLVGVVSFAAYAVLSAYAPDLRTGSDGRPHALSRSAIGFSAAVRLLQGTGRTVIVSRGRPPKPPGQRGLLVLTPPPGTDAKSVMAFSFPAPILVVLPKWQVAPKPLHQGWVEKAGLLATEVAAGPVAELSGGIHIERRKGVSSPVLASGSPALFPAGRTVALGRIDSLQTISGADWTPVLVDEQGRAVLALSRKRPMFVLADPDLLANHGLAQLANARAADAIVTQLDRDGTIVFDVTLSGFKRGRSLLRLALEPPFLGVTACLAAAALLMGLYAAGRFGPPAAEGRDLPLGARGLADNSAALVRMARREPRMAPAYAALCREAAAAAVGAPRDLDPAQLEQLLDRLGAARGLPEAFSALAAEAGRTRTNAELTGLALRLHQWKLEMTRERR